jgi:hypothetical protein
MGEEQVQKREAWIDPEMLGKEEYNYNIHANLEPTGEERYLLDKAIEADKKLNQPSVGEVVRTAISDNWIVPAVSRMIDRSGREEDADFFIDKDMQDKIDQDYDKEESKYLQESKSREDYLGRLQDIEEDRARDMTLSRAGATGMAASLAASVLDPVTWAVGFGTGKLATVGKAANNIRVAKAAMIAGVENATIESILVHNDTQSSFNDVILAAAMGAGLGAGGAALAVRGSKIKKAAREAGEAGKMSEVLEATIDPASKTELHKLYPDADLSEAFRNNQRYREDLHMKSKGAYDQETLRVIQEEMQAKQTLDELRVSSKAEAAASNPKIAEINGKISELELKLESSKSGKSGIRKKIGKLKAELKAQTPAALDSLDSAMTALARAKELRISSIGNKTPSELKAIMAGHEATVKAKADLKAWDNMTDVQKTQISSPDGLSNIKLRAEQERARVDSMTADDTKLDADKLDTDTDMETMTPEDEAAYLMAQARGKIREIVESGADPKQASSEFDEYYQLALEEYYDQIGSDFKMKLGHQEPTSFNSVGAAGTGFNPNEVYKLTPAEAKKVKELIAEGAALDQSYVQPWMPKNSLLKKMFSVATELLNSESLPVRAMASKLVESPQGGKQAATTAANQVSLNNRLIKAAGEDRYNQALNKHYTDNKVGKLDLVEREKEMIKFNELVFKELSNPGSFSHNKNVIEAAEGIRGQLRKGRQLQKEAGVKGFDGINLDNGYAPVVVDHNKIKMGLHEHGEAKMKKLISEAYGVKYTDRSVPIVTNLISDFLADVHIAKARKGSLTLKDKVNTEHTLEQAMSNLEEKLESDLPEDMPNRRTQIDNAKATIKQSVGYITKKRASGISLMVPKLIQSEGLDMVKFIKTDIPTVMEGFTRESAANAALGKVGFKSREELLEQINLIQKYELNRGEIDPKRVREDIELFDLIQKQIYGDPTDELSAKARNRIGTTMKIVAIRDLAVSGLAQFAELGNLIAHRNWTILWDSMSVKELFKPAWAREGGKGLGKHIRPDFEEMDIAFGFPGEDHILNHNRLSNEFVGDAMVSGREKRFHNVVDKLGRWSSITSGMKNAQAGLDKIALRSVAGEVKKMALAGKFTLRKAALNRAGWDAEFLGELSKWMKANKATGRYDGKDINLFNFDKMPADLQLRVVSGIQRLAYADIQKSMIGELPKAMSHTVGRLITQHRSFQIGSMEKQLLHGIRHDQIALASSLSFSVFTAGVSVAMKSAHRNLGEEDGWEKFLEEMDPSNKKTWWTIASNIGALSSLGIIGDLASTFGALPEGWSETGGYRQMGATSIPALGYARDVAKLPKAAFKLAYGDGEDDEAQKLMKAFHKAIPGLNMIGVNQALDVIETNMKQ